jgi:HEAT repeat protein
MNSEEAMERYLAEYDSDTWEEHSDGYQRLLEECGEKLLPALLTCTKHPQAEVRAAAASLLATRRPHTPEMIEAIAPLINDSEPLVRIKTIECLKQFGDLALPLVDQLYEIVQRERAKKDQVPRILAMGALLHIDRDTWEEELMPELTKAATAQTGKLADFVAVCCLLELHGIEMPEEPDMPGEPDLGS